MSGITVSEDTLREFLTELRLIVAENHQKQYPDILTASHISEIMHISKRMAYELMDRKGFPLIRLGKNKRVIRDAFFEWLESQKVC